jgi:acyl-CoA synthetase (AMP-forming)/AMP-acid ligase II
MTTFADVLHDRAAEQPHNQAFCFWQDHQERTLTYAELDERARAIAALLGANGAGCRTVLLMLAPGPDYVAAVFGCLYAGAIAVPAYPAARERDLPRLRAVAADAQASIALTSVRGRALDLETVTTWLAVEDAREPAAWPELVVDRADPALLQYTSSEAGDPRGVMITHANLLDNSAAIHAALGYSPGATFVSCLAPHQDVGLVGGILQPVFGGVPALLMSPVECLRHPLRWLRAISGVPGVVAAAPNLLYDLCVRKVAPDYRVGLNLAGWRVALNVAEPMCADTMQRFAEAFAVASFDPEAMVPAYGLAEATLLVAGARRARPGTPHAFDRAALEAGRAVPSPGGRTLFSCGHAAGGQRVAIVDPDTGHRRPDGAVGEIWVTGPSVAAGYWGRPELTARTFGARLEDEPLTRFLRTGDRGFLHDGELFVMGEEHATFLDAQPRDEEPSFRHVAIPAA